MRKEERTRTIIENVKPAVENGKYPAKRTVHEKVTVSADIFCDGHDKIRAKLFYKKSNGKWQHIPMKPVVNDRWEAVFIPDKEGIHEFTVKAWIDHFSTWKNGLHKKYEAGQNVELEFKTGAELIKKTAERAEKAQKSILEEYVKKLNAKGVDEQKIRLIENPELDSLMDKYHDPLMVTEYEKKLTIDVERKKALFSSWYELFPRSTSPERGKHGTFKDCVNLLPRIARMGFDVVYLPPIHPIGEKNRKGRNNSTTAQPGEPGSPWAIGSKEGGHKAIHKELGTLADFKNLVKEAERHGIEIALDIAFQCAPDHPYVKEHPEWFIWRPDGTVQYAENPPKKYEDVLPLNFETPDWMNLWKELKSVFDHWIAQGVKIFRVDNPHTKAFNFWEWCIAEIRNEHPDVIFLAEAFTRPRVMERLAKVGFTQSYTYYTWRYSRQDMIEYLTELTQTDMRDYFRPNFWPNTPDILPQSLQHAGESSFIQRLVMAATLSSNYGIYGPVFEFGYNHPFPGKEEYIDNEKYEIKNWDWNNWNRMCEIIRLVNKARKEHPALQTTWNLHFCDNNNEQILAYLKYDDQLMDFVLVVVNLDPHSTQEDTIRVPMEKVGLSNALSYELHDIVSGDTYHWQGDWNYIKIDPHMMPAHIFHLKQNPFH